MRLLGSPLAFSLSAIYFVFDRISFVFSIGLTPTLTTSSTAGSLVSLSNVKFPYLSLI